MLKIHELAESAAAAFSLSLRDDPNLWHADQAITPEIVRETADAAARENVQSALARALGNAADTIATDMGVAVSEDGPLADLADVLARHVEGLAVDLQGVAAASDWQERVDALKAALGQSIMAYDVPAVPVANLLAYINSEPRLRGKGLGKGVSALSDTPAGIPAFLTRDTDISEPDAEDYAAPDMAYFDEEAAEDDVEAEPVADVPVPRKRGRPARVKPDGAGTQPRLITMLLMTGVADVELSELFGMSRSYFSLVRHGKRPWPGLVPDQIKRVLIELEARREAIDAAVAALGDRALTHADGA